MKISTKFSAAAISIALAAACGGSADNAALTKSFTYGAPQAPSSAESSAASTAQSDLSSTTSFSTQPDAVKGAAIVAFSDSLAAAALGSSGLPTGMQAPSGSDFTHALRSGLYNLSTCGVVVGSGVTFTNCTITEGSFTVSFSGSISVSGSTVTWSITGGLSGTDSSTSTTINISHHQSGSFAVTGTTLKGNAVSDFSGTVTSSGQSVSFGLATAAVSDLTYQSAPSFCVTNGTVEVKRVWTQTPSGASGAGFADAGVKLSWNGCNTVLVAHSQ